MHSLAKNALVAIPLSMALTGCFIPVIPKTETPKYDPPKFEYDNKQLDEILRDLESQGGQPGSLTVRGVLARISYLAEEGSEDRPQKVKVTARAGLNKAGERIKVDDKHKPTLDESVPLPFANSLDSEFTTDLYVYGCEGRSVPGHDLSNPSPEPAESETFNARVKSIRAKKIVLCGKNPFDAQQIVVMDANELVLVDFDYVKIGTTGSAISFNAEKLYLFGKNSISSQGLKGKEVGFMQSPMMTVSARYWVYFMGEGASLQLSSEGPSYEAPANANSN